jgi:hypothetical protein
MWWACLFLRYATRVVNQLVPLNFLRSMDGERLGGLLNFYHRQAA